MKQPVRHVVSVSGGKDSTATLLLALSRVPREQIVAIFCDTGNEIPITYVYLDDLERHLGIKIHRLKADFTQEIAAKRRFIARDQRTGRDRKGRKVRWSNKAKRRALEVLHPTGNPYLDLCLWKGRFPSRMAQFCTEELKRNIAVTFQLALIDQGYAVVSWQGIRRDESMNRQNAKKAEHIGPKLWAFRPLVDWTAQQTVDYVRSRDCQLNPLYSQGQTRVGCVCINSNKQGLAQVAYRYPAEIERIAKWEDLVGQASKRGFSTFFADSDDRPDRRAIFADLNIHARAAWAKGDNGSLDLFDQKDLGLPVCASAYGLCE